MGRLFGQQANRRCREVVCIEENKGSRSAEHCQNTQPLGYGDFVNGMDI